MCKNSIFNKYRVGTLENYIFSPSEMLQINLSLPLSGIRYFSMVEENIIFSPSEIVQIESILPLTRETFTETST